MNNSDRKKLKTLFRRLELLSKEYVKIRSGGLCERCGQPMYCEWAHYVSRQYLQLKYHVNNTFYLCKERCHPFMDAYPMEKRIWVFKRIGEEKHNELIQLKTQLFKPSLEYFEEQKAILLLKIQKAKSLIVL